MVIGFKVIPEHQRVFVPKESYTLREGKGKKRLPVPKSQAPASHQPLPLTSRTIDSPVTITPPSDAVNSAVKKLLAPFVSSETLNLKSKDETKISEWMIDEFLKDSKGMNNPIRFGHDIFVTTTGLLKALESKIQRKWRTTPEKITLISFLKDLILSKGPTLSKVDREKIQTITENILNIDSKDLHFMQLQSIALEVQNLLAKEHQDVKPFNEKLEAAGFVLYERIESFYLLYKTIDLEALATFASDLKNEAERVFITIPLKEFVEYPTTPQACTNISEMLTYFTKISEFTRIQVLAASSTKSLEQFILLADASFQTHDWLTSFSILAPLVFTDITESDLPEAWKDLTPGTRAKFDKLQTFFTKPGSFKERLKTLSELNQRNIACIPDMLSFLREMKLANSKLDLINGRPNTRRLKDFAEIIGALFHAQEKFTQTQHYRKSDIMIVINKTTLEPRP